MIDNFLNECEPRFYNMTEVAHELGVPVVVLHRWIKSGRFACYGWSYYGERLITRDMLERWKAQLVSE